MPSYEVALVLKKMAKAETATVLKRIATQILNNNGILFKMENLGTRALPYVMSSHGSKYKEGSYFVMQFDSSPTLLDTLTDEYRRDVDIIRSGFTKVSVESAYNCTLEEELKPPAYRKDVKAMIEEGRKRERIFNPNTGLNYNPWSR